MKACESFHLFLLHCPEILLIVLQAISPMCVTFPFIVIFAVDCYIPADYFMSAYMLSWNKMQPISLTFEVQRCFVMYCFKSFVVKSLICTKVLSPARLYIIRGIHGRMLKKR